MWRRKPGSSPRQGHMMIVNITRGTLIAGRVNVATSFWRRSRGLIGRRSLSVGDALILRPCIAVHALFVSIPLDVLHLDKNGRVLRVLPFFQPWRIGPIVWRSRTVIELPAGTVARTDTVIGDLIVWRDQRNAGP